MLLLQLLEYDTVMKVLIYCAYDGRLEFVHASLHLGWKCFVQCKWIWIMDGICCLVEVSIHIIGLEAAIGIDNPKLMQGRGDP